MFHAVMLLAALTTRKSSLIQGTIFLIAGAHGGSANREVLLVWG